MPAEGLADVPFEVTVSFEGFLSEGLGVTFVVLGLVTVVLGLFSEDVFAVTLVDSEGRVTVEGRAAEGRAFSEDFCVDEDFRVDDDFRVEDEERTEDVVFLSGLTTRVSVSRLAVVLVFLLV